MARESGVIPISDDNRKESLSSKETDGVDDGQEKEHEVELEGPDHGIHADMERFLGKTRKEIMTARALWASNSIRIFNDHAREENSPMADFYISRNLLSLISGRIRTLSPTSRSWPIIDWHDVVGNRWDKLDLWWQMPGFVEFLHTSTRDLDFDNIWDLDVYLNREWCLGAALEAPEFQNLIMKEKFTWNASNEIDFASERDTLGICYENDAKQLGVIGIKFVDGGKFEKHNLARYILDKLVWDTVDGGDAWLEMVHIGGCVAKIVAKAQAQAAKKRTPRFPPWHVLNSHKYLLNEEPTPPTQASKRGGDIIVQGPPKRATRGV